MRLELRANGLRVFNEGDFTVHFRGVRRVDPPFVIAVDEKKRMARGTNLTIDAPHGAPYRVDQSYVAMVDDDQRGRWELTYEPPTEGQSYMPRHAYRLWPRWISLVVQRATRRAV